MAWAKDNWKKFLNNMNSGLTANPSITLFIVISLVIHLLDVFSDFRNTSFRIFAYLILTIAAWLSLFKDQENPGVIDIANIKVPVILSSIAIFAPYFGGIIPFLGSSQAFQTAIIFFPAWILYLCFAMGQNWFITICRWVIVLLVLFLVLPAFINGFINDLRVEDIETEINVQQTISNTMRDLSYGVNSIIKNIGTAWKDAYNSIIKTATGDYYSGEVDKYEHEPVGVYLEDLEASDSKFFEGEKITVWAVLKAKTLDKEININISCYAKEGDKKIEGNITPKNEFNIATEEEEYLDCVFDKLNPGKKDVTFNAEFNFETMAYLKTYFMDKESLRAFKREEIDVFQHYGISHINPIARYTNGPIGIGMRTSEPLPIGVYSNQDNTPFFFGITIENNWDGIIKNITGLDVQVHESLELTNCDHEFEFNENKDGYNIYSLVPDKRTEDIKQRKFHSIKCRLNPTDPKSLLGNEPITTRYFRVTANYIYELEKSTPVEIEEVKEYISPEDAMTQEEETQEFKDKLNEKIDGKTNKDIACEKIKGCSDYGANYYDKLGFNDQVWCDDDPCKLMCYSSFKEDEGGVYYDSCEKCPSATIADYSVPEFCNLYKTEKYCEKDSCNFGYYDIECKWENNLCVGKQISPEEYALVEEGCQYTEEEVKDKIRDATKEYNVPESLALGVAFTESSLKHCENNNVKVSSNSDDNKKIIGIMQIQVETGKSICGVNINQLKNIDTNILCGIKILKKHKIDYCSNPGKELFIEKVDANCDNQEFRTKYYSYSYESDCWDMALRAYNGFGCQNEIIAGYVERVRNNIKGQGFS